ncbi:aquaporin-like isoform X1 [Drosophila nasuta]|uniref:aquaporin-like isoform X1 n=1 Tax=Drosophila nasuta TaxID=42062 RepID=UPI00295E80FC|nr:aquaporin-like isoform X1 [Drosophila nasuta]
MSDPQQQHQSVPSIATILNAQQLQRSDDHQQHQQPIIKIPMTTKNAQKSKSNSQDRRFKGLLRNTCIVVGEFLATAMLMFLGCMGCAQSPAFVNSHFQCSINFGFVVLICIQCFGCVSGAHLNPSVTLANYIYRLISWPMAIAYFVAQMVGAFVGYGLVKASLPEDVVCSSDTPKGVCITALGEGISAGQGVLIEFLLTVILIIICCAVWDPRNATFGDSTGIRFGLAIACISLTGGQFTGASMNPARSFAPALWNNAWDNHWIYWVGPLVGAVFAAFLYKYVFRPTGAKPEEELPQ